MATARIATRLADAGLMARASELLDRAKSEVRDPYEFDLMSGRSGAIAALVALNQTLANSSLLDFAALLGDELLDIAEKSEHGYSWQSRERQNKHNLTGLSHGASGAA